MRALNHRIIRSTLWIVTFVILAIVFVPTAVFAQEDSHPNGVLSLVKSVVLDPTTYAPAALSYTSQKADWDSSQVLFNAGFMEHNYRYTITGQPDAKPLSYSDGTRQIRRDAFGILQQSVLNNVATQLVERSLSEKYPHKRTLFRTLSWVERISFSAYVGYMVSADHFRQVQRNQAMARQFGLP